MEITQQVIDKFDSVLTRGLCRGVGNRNGQMCIEAALCYALDLPHGDDPECVTDSVREYKITLNDAKWSSPEARAKGLRSLGIAQLGSKGIVNSQEFSKRLVKKTIQVIIPAIFREVFSDNVMCLDAAKRCEIEGTISAATAAAYATTAAAYVADAAYAAYAANAAAYATTAAAYVTDAANAAAYAAVNAAAAARAASAEDDKYLLLSASLALEVLKELNSPGVAWL